MRRLVISGTIIQFEADVVRQHDVGDGEGQHVEPHPVRARRRHTNPAHVMEISSELCLASPQNENAVTWYKETPTPVSGPMLSKLWR